MKTLTEELWFEVPSRRGFINITNTIEKLVRDSGVQEGLALVNAQGLRRLVGQTRAARAHRAIPSQQHR
jgi:thiamine phosphate synthase YjbQ (UPF0047 family)